MTNIGRFTWVGNRLASVVGRRFCIGGGVADHPFRSHPRSTCLFISPYHHAQSTLDEEIEEYKKQLVEYLEPDSPLYDRYLKYYVRAAQDMATPSSSFRNYQHVRATPLLDLLSVSIHNTTSHHVDDDCEKDHTPLQVYGTIQLIDVDNDSASYVYRRPINKPETILPGYNLTLINSKPSHSSLHIPTAASYKLRFNLKHDRKAIAKGDFDLQLLNDKIMTQLVPARNGFYASLHYATLPHAVVATLNLTLTKIAGINSDQSESSHARIYGCISASTKLQQGNVISSVLLDKPPSHPLMVTLGKPFELSRHVLAVPAYSSLEIKADLWDHHTNQQFASHVTLANCQARDNDVNELECILAQNYQVQVQIRWNIAYEVLDKGRIPLDKPQASKDELLASSPIPSFCGSPLVEVFSITVFPDFDGNSSICGTIGVFDDDIFGGKGDPYCIFERDAWNAVSLNRDMKITCLKWPESPFRGESFGMRLHFSDDKGCEICRGHFYWDKLSTTCPISWYGKLISSVIRGKHGYATVHYAMFPNAVEARIIVKIIPDYSDQFECMVVGNISACYSSFTCSSYNENKFWRSTLLGDDVNSMVSCSNTLLHLQKSALVVPLDSSLILDFKFKIGVIGRTSQNGWISKLIDSFDEVVEFKVNVGKLSFKSIAGKGYKVEVFVRWIRSRSHKD